MAHTITATDARATLYNLLAEVNASHDPVTITGKNGNAVLVSEDDWNAVMETVALHAVPGLVEDINAGRQEPIDTLPPRLVTCQRACTNPARKDAKKLARSGLQTRAQRLLEVVQENPFSNPPPYEKLVGDLNGCYSRRINLQHRLVYEVLESDGIVRVLAMWSHYE